MEQRADSKGGHGEPRLRTGARGLPAEPTGYGHADYAESLAEWGTPLHLPRSNSWLLRRAIPGSSRHDAMGPYPLFSCHNWSQLAADLDEVSSDLVSVVLVPESFTPVDRTGLERCFDRVTYFKDHFIADLRRPVEENVPML